MREYGLEEILDILKNGISFMVKEPVENYGRINLEKSKI